MDQNTSHYYLMKLILKNQHCYLFYCSLIEFVSEVFLILSDSLDVFSSYQFIYFIVIFNICIIFVTFYYRFNIICIPLSYFIGSLNMSKLQTYFKN